MIEERKIKVIQVTKTWQGEGNGAGRRVLLLRFKHCNLNCPWCFGIRGGRRVPRVTLSGSRNQKITKILPGDKLMTFDAKGNPVETEVVKTFRRSVDVWLRIRVNGTLYYVTPEHQIFTTRGLIRADKLKEGDFILHSTPRQKMSFMMTLRNNAYKLYEAQRRGLDVEHKCSLNSNLHTSYKSWKNKVANYDKTKVQSKFEVQEIKHFDRTKSPRLKPLEVYNFSCSPYNSYLVDNMWVHNCDTQVLMRNSFESEISSKEIQDILDRECLDLMITGGEPTHPKHFEDTLWLFSNLNYGFCFVETNGFQLLKLIEAADPNKLKNVYFQWSPKIHDSKSFDREVWRLEQLLLLKRKVDFNFIVKLVYSKELDDRYGYLLSMFLEKVKSLNANNICYLMPLGTTYQELLKNSASCFDMAEKYKLNFSSRDHIVYNFI